MENGAKGRALAQGAGWGVLFALLCAGCTASHHRRSADKEVYRIVQQVESRVFGQTNAFTIDTPYSGRKPAEILPAELIEDRLQTNRRALKIEEALELMAQESRRYQTEKERLYLTTLSLTGARYEFSPQFFASSTASLDRSSDGERSLGVGSQIGVNQLLKSGGSLGVRLANDLLRFYTGDQSRSVVSTISVNLVQPLLRGFGRDNTAVENLTQAERNVVYAVRDFSFFQDEFAVEIVNDYISLLALKDTIRNRYTNYLSRVQATQRLEARAKDREALSDVDQVRQAELSAKNNYVNAVASYWNALDQFKIKLGLPLSEKVSLDDQALTDVEQTGLVPVPLDPIKAYRFAVQKQLPLLNSIDQFEDSKRKIRVLASQLKAGLDLFADASLDSEGTTDYTKFDPDQIRAGVGVELDLPLDRLRERNSYRATLVSFESELRGLTLALDTLRDNIDRGLRTVEQRRENYLIQKSALALANRRVESTTLLLQAGRAEVRDLVDAQDAQINAQTAVTAALVAHQESRLRLMLDIGALRTDTERFWLQDHLAGLPGRIPAVEATVTEQAVVPPDQLFNN